MNLGQKKQKNKVSNFKDDTPRTASPRHTLALVILLPLPSPPHCVTAHREHTGLGCPEHDQTQSSSALHSFLCSPLGRLHAPSQESQEQKVTSRAAEVVVAAAPLLLPTGRVAEVAALVAKYSRLARRASTTGRLSLFLAIRLDQRARFQAGLS